MDKIKIFLDTEFTSLQKNADLISLALVSEDGKEFYAEFTDYNLTKAGNDKQWIVQNVIGNLILTKDNESRNLDKMYIRGNRSEITSALRNWLNQFGIRKDDGGNIIPHIRIWADVPHYDWVLFCELFGGARKIPPQIHYMVMDLATLLFCKGIKPDTPRIELLPHNELPEGVQHNALFDARVGMRVLKKYLER